MYYTFLGFVHTCASWMNDELETILCFKSIELQAWKHKETVQQLLDSGHEVASGCIPPTVTCSLFTIQTNIFVTPTLGKSPKKTKNLKTSDR